MEIINEENYKPTTHGTYRVEVIYEEGSNNESEEIHIGDLDEAPTKMENTKP